MRGLWYMTLGIAAFVAITFFEQLPIIGWLGGVVSLAAWILLTRALVDDDGGLISNGIATVWAAAIGGVTGLIGALTAWLAQTGNLIGFATPPGDRVGAAFGFIGATFGLVYWPLIGAAVCAIAALYLTAKFTGSGDAPSLVRHVVNEDVLA